MFRPVGSILSKRRFGKSTDAVLAMSIRQTTQKIIDAEFAHIDGEIAAAVKVKAYSRGTLTISCPQIVAAELLVRGEGLKEDINRALGSELVEKIVFRAR